MYKGGYCQLSEKLQDFWKTLSAEGDIAQPAEGTEQGLSWSVAAKVLGVPGNTHKVQQQHPFHSSVLASWP